MERCKSAQLELFNIVIVLKCTQSDQRGCASAAKNPGTNEQRQGGPLVFRSMQGASSTASAPALFVGRAVSVVTRPPACGNLKQSVTHTHTHSAALRRSRGLNRRLKSLRNKRKKTRKSSAKRAREKDRGSKR